MGLNRTKTSSGIVQRKPVAPAPRAILQARPQQRETLSLIHRQLGRDLNSRLGASGGRHRARGMLDGHELAQEHFL
ncbi:MAG TPA: hypothetical protein VHS96_18035, partial [Bacteroidia bacterium]|nr:hypothetical protein [Bacteroidia bacterium]